MPDLNSDALGIWEHLKPAIDKEIEQKTRGMVQRRKMKVTTAPSIATGKIGVTEAFGPEMSIPFATNLISATVGDMVWVEFMYGATNAFASMFASADEKDWDVAGDLTVHGVLDVTPRRCYANLSSEGWYRVCAISFFSYAEACGAAGGVLRFAITDTYDTHTIDLLFARNSNVKFVNEASASNSNLKVDKIRYTFTGTSPYNGYVDVHLLGSNSTYIGISFDYVSIGLDRQAMVVAQNLQSVAESPSGETVLPEYEYTFIETSGGKKSFTPSHGTSAFGGCWYSRSGEYVTVHVGLTGITANTNHIIGTLPVGYRPVSQCCSAGSSETYGQEAHLYIRENGNIDVWSPNSMASLDATFMWR